MSERRLISSYNHTVNRWLEPQLLVYAGPRRVFVEYSCTLACPSLDVLPSFPVPACFWEKYVPRPQRIRAKRISINIARGHDIDGYMNDDDTARLIYHFISFVSLLLLPLVR